MAKESICAICGDLFAYNRRQKTCSRVCGYAYQAKGWAEKPKRKSTCPACGELFLYRSGQKYCSQKCNGQARIGTGFTREEQLANRKAYREANRDKIHASNVANKDQKKAWAKTHRDRIREQKKEWHERHKIEVAASRKRYMESDRGKAWKHNWYARYMSRPEIRIKKLAVGAMHRAKKSGIEFDTNLLESLPLLDAKYCACCGCEFNYETVKLGVKTTATRSSRSASLDRLDSTKGYTVENTRIICWGCNSLKSDGTLEDFENLVRYLRRESPVRERQECSANNAVEPCIDRSFAEQHGRESIAAVQ